MEAISQAAAEITAEMPDGGVDVRLNGRELEFVVHTPPPAPPATAPAPPAADDAEDDGAIARITLRIPESVKAKAEEMAARSGHSLNTWLVNVVRAATTARPRSTSTSTCRASRSSAATTRSAASAGSKRMTGWV